MKCKICGHNSECAFTAKVLNKYEIEYFLCEECGFLQTERPHWLEEAYQNSINVSDVGIMQRNIYLSKVASVIIQLFLDKESKFLDFAGGYGIFVRLMRDYGYDFYWHDKYTNNILALGFESDLDKKYDLVTAFEVVEHFENPLGEIEKMLKMSDNLLISTNLLPSQIPAPDAWWYYGHEHGQHISFFSRKSFEYIAENFHLNYYTNNENIHFFTKEKINNLRFNACLKLARFGLSKILNLSVKSLTKSDFNKGWLKNKS